MNSKGKELYMYILGSIIVIGIFVIVGLLIYVAMPPGNEQVLLVLLGVLAAKFADVVGYFYGSSKGSADKTELMNKAKEEKPE